MDYENCAFPKPTRKRNRKLLAEIKKRPCLICSGRPCDPCHFVSRGAGGDDSESNVFAACRRHHDEQHRIGIKSFTEKYPAIKRWRKEVDGQSKASK